MKLLALIKKEFYRFFRDPRLIVTMLLPGVVIFLFYSLLGNVMWDEINGPLDTYEFKVYTAGSEDTMLTAFLENAVEGVGSTLEWLPTDDLDAAKAAVEAEDATALLVFTNFDSVERSSVQMYFNMDSDESLFFRDFAGSVMEEYSKTFTIETYSVTGEVDFGIELMSSLLPFLIVILIFSACMSVTLESVAGEKERGTLSTILVTSVKRSHLALGKIIPLSCISMIGAASSFLGVALSMPKLMGVSVGVLGGYSIWSYLLIFLLIASVVPFIVSAISLVSAWSKSVKEASAYTSVIMILVMVISIIGSFVPEIIGKWVIAVPVLNAVVAMQMLLTGSLPILQSLVSVCANLVYTSIFVFVITKMFSSEKIMFGK